MSSVTAPAPSHAVAARAPRARPARWAAVLAGVSATLTLAGLVGPAAAAAAETPPPAAPPPGAVAAAVAAPPAAAPAVAVPTLAPTPRAAAADVEWYTVALSDGAVITAAVARPPAGIEPTGPAVVVLPGTDGLRRQYVDLARWLAVSGHTAVVGCWFAPGLPFTDDTIPCPSAPPFAGATGEGLPAVDGLVALARRASGDPGPVALVGHSRGGTLALLAAAHDDGGAIGAVVASAALYSEHLAPTDADDLPVSVADHVRVPVLALHGTADPLVPVDQARAWAWVSGDRLDRVEHELEGGGHALPFDATSARWWWSEVLGFLGLVGLVG